MKNYVIINGVNSNTITGLMINELPPISKPEMRVKKEEIDGRDGDITTNLGYSAYDKTFTIGLFGTGYDINDIVAFFNGEGTIVFSNEPDKYYNFKIIEQIDYERLQIFKTASITIHVQPFKYPLEEEPIEIEYEYVEQEGESITLNNTEGDVPLKTTLKGNTSQYTTTGKNLMKIKNTDSNGLKTIVNQDGSLTASGKVTTTVAYLDTGENVSIPSGTYTLSIQNTLSVPLRIALYNGSTSIGTMTISAGQTETTTTTSQEITAYNVFLYNLVADTSYSFSIKLMLESSSSATSYEPYTGGIPSPNPDYPQPINVVSGDNTIEVCGKNLFDENTILINGGMTYSNEYYTGQVNTLRAYMNANQDLIKFKENTRYTISLVGYNGTATSSRVRIVYTDGTNSESSNLSSSEQSISITSTENKTINYITFNYGNAGTFYIKDFQVELGNTATTYQPYQSQTYPINLPVDMELCKIGDYQDYFTKNSGKNLIGILQQGGLNNGAETSATNRVRTDFIQVKSNEKYTISNLDTIVNQTGISFYDENKNFISAYSSGGWVGIPVTITTLENAKYIRIMFRNTSNVDITPNLNYKIMVNEGSTALPYEPYGTGQWCKYNAIGKYVYNNDLGENGTSATSIKFVTPALNITANISENYLQAYCNLLTRTRINNTGLQGTTSTKKIRIEVSTNYGVDYSAIRTIFVNKGLVIYYPYETPYLSLIENTNLIEQLDAIASAYSYEEQTNISQVNNDLPFNISAKAMKKDTNEVEVENIGNVYSRPTLDIKGTGTIDIYKDNVQILQVDMNDNNEIVIENMEAYNPSTSELMNRKVVGDYNKITIPSGTSTIKASGELEKLTITNYTRWL